VSRFCPGGGEVRERTDMREARIVLFELSQKALKCLCGSTKTSPFSFLKVVAQLLGLHLFPAWGVNVLFVNGRGIIGKFSPLHYSVEISCTPFCTWVLNLNNEHGSLGVSTIALRCGTPRA
jgi:hypothetical protein